MSGDMEYAGDSISPVMTLADLAAQVQRRRGGAAFTEYSLGGTNGQRERCSECITQAIFDEVSNDLAEVGYGERVLARTNSPLRSFVAALTLWARGAVFVPLEANTSLAMTTLLADALSATWAYNADKREAYRLLPSAVKSHFRLRSEPRITGNDLALIIPTSGSTGSPKGVALTHENVIFALASIQRYLGITRSDSILSVLPLSFDYGLYQPLFAAATGCQVIFLKGLATPYHVLSACNDLGTTILPIVPSLAVSIVRILERDTQLPLPQLRAITNTGGHLPFSVIQRLQGRLPDTKIYPMYGLTECKRALFLPPKDLERKPGSVGLPIPGTDARVFVKLNHDESARDDGFVEAEPGEVGELFVRGRHVMQGYIGVDDRDNISPIVNGDYRDDIWLATGDLFYRDDEGYFFFVSREKDIIKQDGYNIIAGELEARILSLDVDIEAVFVGSDVDDNGIEIAHAFLVVTAMHKDVEDRIRRKLVTMNRRQDKPKRVTFLDQFPLTSNGKVDRKILTNIQKDRQY